MPIKRRESKHRMHRITPEAIAAFEAGDYHGLHNALGLFPHESSPLPADITALGVRQGEPPDWMTNAGTIADYRQAQALQRELIAAGATTPEAELVDDEGG